MAKYLLRSKARNLRKKGVSVKKIALSLGISKSTASIWVRDIILTIEQLEDLKKSMLKGAEKGRLKSALLQKEKWLETMEEAKEKGVQKLKNLTDRELLIAGLALYWGEGSKKSRQVEFCNSDPKMIQFLMIWLKKCFDIQISEIKGYVGINEIHKSREEMVKNYWSSISGIPLNQFNKTSFKKARNKKIYDNFENHYGTLAVRITKPARFYSIILGLIEGLYEAGSGLVSRGVS
ncbi:hypothetical protein C4559_01130 [Candidatus Microgenomates bacterium]|nr:MAG: hypothetical protein C4559_01130 [Candidatus Microgenomates bacterium]